MAISFSSGEVLTASNLNAATNAGNLIGFERRTTDYTVYAGLWSGASNMFASDITWTTDSTHSYLLELNLVCSMSATAGGYVSFNFGTSSGASVITDAACISSSNANATNVWTISHNYVWTPGTTAAVNLNARGVVGNSATATGDGGISVLFNGGTFYPSMAVYDLGVI